MGKPGKVWNQRGLGSRIGTHPIRGQNVGDSFHLKESQTMGHSRVGSKLLALSLLQVFRRLLLFWAGFGCAEIWVQHLLDTTAVYSRGFPHEAGDGPEHGLLWPPNHCHLFAAGGRLRDPCHLISSSR